LLLRQLTFESLGTLLLDLLKSFCDGLLACLAVVDDAQDLGDGERENDQSYDAGSISELMA